MQISAIREIAYACPAHLASSNAQAILLLLYNEEVSECEAIADIIGGTRNKKIEDELKSDTEAYLLDNYPEPFTESTKIPYFIPENNQGKIIISDVFGRIIESHPAIPGKNILELKTAHWNSGVYSYSLYVNEIFVDSKKLILSH